jgi:hypothetical protein
MKLFIWKDPYDVSYGSSLLIAVAETVEDARAQALKGRVCAFGEDYEHKQPKGTDDDWRPQITLGEPTRVLDLPCAEWHEWSE